MEKKTTRRLIGVLVVVALVIILLPLMFTNNESGTTQIAENTPVLPDTIPETNKPSDTAAMLADNDIKSVSSDSDTEHANDSAPAAKAAPIAANENDGLQPLPVGPKEKAANTKTMKVAAKKTNASEQKPANATNQIAANNSSQDSIIDSIKKPEQKDNFVIGANGEAAAVQPDKTIAAANKKNTDAKHPATNVVDADNQSGWVVQLGSFRNTANVKTLVKKLDDKGYHPFTHYSKVNGQTRVYVGPKFKREAAVELLNKLQQDVNLRGVVLMYKPQAA